MPKGKSKSEMEKEVIIGCFPPCVCAKILFTSTEEKRVTPALLKVDLLNANVHLTFSCTFKEEPSECSYLTLQCMYVNLVHVYSSMFTVYPLPWCICSSHFSRIPCLIRIQLGCICTPQSYSHSANHSW